MVVFTCNYCGESLQKPTVEKHYTFSKCPKNKNLTCVDCLKDFRGEEYVPHTKCLSENARYSAKGEQVDGMKKGELKQESWTEMIATIMREDPRMQRANTEVLKIIKSQPNVPRKKHKFLNFMQSSTGKRVGLKDIDYVWNIIEDHNAKIDAKKASESGVKENGKPKSNENKEASNGNEAKVKKRKNADGEVTSSKKVKPNEDIEVDVSTAFDFNEKILEVLQKKKSVTLEKVQKKVINAYLKHKNLTEASPKIIKKFNKKLKKIDQVKIEDDNVVLIES